MRIYTGLTADLHKVLEAFWEYSDSDASTVAEKEAALRLQEAVGYKTVWDKERQSRTTRQRSLLNSVSVAKVTSLAKEFGGTVVGDMVVIPKSPQ